MNDNPFSEPGDNDRTIIRGVGGRAGQPPRPSGGGAAPAPLQAPVQAPMQPAVESPFPQPMAPPAALAGEGDELPRIGRSPLAAAAAPLLDLLGRLGTGSAAAGSADAVRDSAIRALKAFEADCRAAKVSDELLRASHYALCAAIDDTAMSIPWSQAGNWAGRSLSSTFHQDVRSGERFFDLLGGMQKEPGRYQPALEICYFCLALGFRGRYRLDPRGTAELDRVRESLYQLLLQLEGSKEPELSPRWKGVDAPYRGPDRGIPAWVPAVVALSLLALGYVAAIGWVNAKGDDAQQRLMQLPPAKAPTIVREAPPTPPAAVPQPDAGLARLRTLLAPEIAEGVVALQGDAHSLMVRIMARGMFESGSADVQPRFVALLGRIGEGLKAEPGQVMVLGHTDNQPIRTVRFPSNFALSTARAESARTILAQAAGQPERYAFAGRADTEPLAPNDTAEGRERNRRIEVVLTHGEAQK